MLKDKIRKAEDSIPKGNAFNVSFGGKMTAVLRDKDGNIKDIREVGL